MLTSAHSGGKFVEVQDSYHVDKHDLWSDCIMEAKVILIHNIINNPDKHI